MRLSVLTAILLGCASMAGCASSNPETALSIKPSAEVTSSVKAGPVPEVSVGEGKVKADGAEMLAWAGPSAESHVFETMTKQSAVPEDRPENAVMAVEPSFGRSAKRSRVYSQQFRDAHPINFGKRAPKHYQVHGVDVSRWQGDIDWMKLRTQGANFAFIKATDGGDHLDPMFQKNWRKAKEAGIKRGAYHFFYWCRVASSQAEWFIRNVPRDPDALPPVIDAEYNGESSCKARISRAKYVEKIKVFAEMLERHYGKRPIIYTAPDFYEDNLAGELTEYPFWLRSVAAHPSKRYPNRRWTFWQYSGSGLSHGVSGKIDLNVFAGSESDWHNWLAGQSGTRTARAD
ncbi:glycoside hydrolase family 25 protein [Shinella sp. CPCC 101442]|uniref:glycoside hydrolase family 25 protein n=1 Tax=Shinella sp. CPCC 101442 TaxID=2932265 RepID=UPI002152964B|nr:glycoside hydrolase family 25 protein [Shinella sp. CPCC 101442]MCR6500006.1 glycoside hydrolase family 25 protein [Shinella sp. CPCC 101442]